MPTERPALHLETRAITGGRADQGGALAPLLWPSTTFETETAAEAAALASSVDPGRFYTRHGNPGVRAFEQAVADLEGAEAARAYASGMGAVTGVILGICSAGDHIVAQRQLYSQTTSVLLGICPRFGIDVTLVDGTEPGAFAAAVRPGKTTLVFAETPANPRLDLVDLDEIGAIKGPVTCVDSTFATPLGQQPLAHGVDLVLHSATKGIAGHNDATLGIVCGSQELIDWLWGFAILQGASASPFDAMNGLRGLRTLGVRLHRQSESAQELAELLEASPHVEGVRYPGLESHPQRDLAKRQLAHMGAVMAFDVVGGREAGQAFVESLALVRMATSLGGPETIVCHPASTTHRACCPRSSRPPASARGPSASRSGWSTLIDLAADLDQALAVAAKRTS